MILLVLILPLLILPSISSYHTWFTSDTVDLEVALNSFGTTEIQNLNLLFIPFAILVRTSTKSLEIICFPHFFLIHTLIWVRPTSVIRHIFLMYIWTKLESLTSSRPQVLINCFSHVEFSRQSYLSHVFIS